MASNINFDIERQTLIIFLLDISISMKQFIGQRRRIDAALETLGTILARLARLSRRGNDIVPQYRIAIFGYSNEVHDLLGGTQTITDIHSRVMPPVSLERDTHTANALKYLERFLQAEIANLNNRPAPLICHLTDAEDFDHIEDPEPIAQRIMRMVLGNGNVLIENIIFRDDAFAAMTDPKLWPGISPQAIPEGDPLQKLGAMSSVLPDSYHTAMINSGFRLDRGTLMLYPGASPEIAEMIFG